MPNFKPKSELVQA